MQSKIQSAIFLFPKFGIRLMKTCNLKWVYEFMIYDNMMLMLMRKSSNICAFLACALWFSYNLDISNAMLPLK